MALFRFRGRKQLENQEDLMNKSKQYEIPKRAVIEAYKNQSKQRQCWCKIGMDFEKF